MIYNIIVAYSFPEYGIGLNNNLPWYIKDDLNYFKNITNNSIVVMGRKTWDSIPKQHKPLKNRYNIIISKSNLNYSNNDNITTINWLKINETLDKLSDIYDNVYFIGGSEIYKLAFNEFNIDKIHITEVYLNIKKDISKFDKFFMKPSEYKLYDKYNLYNVSNIKNSNKLYYRFLLYINNNYINNMNDNEKKQLKLYKSEEEQYLNIMRQILYNGIERDDRTGTGTLSIFGTQQRYNLMDGFPISTTKRVFFRAIFEELSLYISGKTNNNILNEKGIHIWDGNTSRDFLDKRGLNNYPIGDMGETYGFNFRHYGGEYVNCNTEYPPGIYGFDQINNVLNLIKNDPTSRRMIINLWNPATLHKASLPSCLMMYQFYVDTHAKKLSCQIYIRSSDYFLANNWNTCTGALLVHMICNLRDIDLIPGDLIIITGDTHIYKNHIEQVNENLQRKTKPFPKLIFTSGKKNDLKDYNYDDLRLIGYKCSPSINAQMAI